MEAAIKDFNVTTNQQRRARMVHRLLTDGRHRVARRVESIRDHGVYRTQCPSCVRDSSKGVKKWRRNDSGYWLKALDLVTPNFWAAGCWQQLKLIEC
jgi:hypothetical protein